MIQEEMCPRVFSSLETAIVSYKNCDNFITEMLDSGMDCSIQMASLLF